MNNIPQNQYDIPQGGYVAFDALSLRQIIVDRLNEQGTFTDQKYVGSNLASIIDIIAYSYNTLIYYLNRTSTESMFTEAQLYENMNRIVKLIDYNPLGFQTSTLSFEASAVNLPVGIYTIPRYSTITANNISFSFNKDITFAKTVDGILEPLVNFSQRTFLYQGKYYEYPLYIANGDTNETITVNVDNKKVDHFNFDVYVYSAQNGTWSQYTAVENLYQSKGTDLNYQIRLNEKYDYEITFGNNINGLALSDKDKVAIYYLVSDGENGVVGPYTLKPNMHVKLFNTTQLTSILGSIIKDQYNLLNPNQLANSLIFKNTTSSTAIKEAQTPNNIRELAPANFRSQHRLVTINDYNTFLKTNFSNFLASVKTMNNNDYIASYLQYFYSIGINNPSFTNRALINQVLYSDSCSFNNVYIIAVPLNFNSNTPNYLTPSQKQLIREDILPYKTTTTEINFIDPVYKAVFFGVNVPGAILTPATDVNNIQLQIYKTPYSQYNNQNIINNVINVLKNYFSIKNASLGQVIDINLLNQQILQIPGIQKFYTVRTDGTTAIAEGLSLYVWNPNYPSIDVIVTSNNLQLHSHEYPYFFNIDNIINNIVVA